MADYTTEVVLPSKGKPYPENPELAGKIKLRMMTTDDEKIVFGSTTDKMTTNLLKRCVVEPQNFDPDSLIFADRQFLFMQLRIFTYGPDYHLSCTCPGCNEKFEKKISLIDDLVVREASDDLQPIIQIKLPRCGKEVGVKLLTVRDLDAIAKKAKNFAKRTGGKAGDFEFLFRKMAQIETVDFKELPQPELEKFIKEMPALDSAAIEAKVGSGLKIGYDYLVTVTCPACNEEFETVFTPTGEFFRPRFD